ncbi:putative manganese transporter [Pseudoalteromonas sp. MM17-2]|uniref:putative manganese transporter n=1 Tax=Pseudoalteromonas sp. MM17-2 TaxID=2917753 RepID=UPI001EF6EACA|nr:putative manganese transporter [Pseudoalteromonas sp. MM17-2]MCG7542719.1 putative manganese transporter [Pseudoalteromonas sp. MM17-2]
MPVSTLSPCVLTTNWMKVINKRLFFPLGLALLLALPSTRELTLTALSDAFFQVSVFVAATLLLYYLLIKRYPLLELGQFSQRYPKFEVLFAAFLGALPGCGGAIIVVTQFTRGQVSFGAVVAVLSATMGDAAFLLLAASPFDALLVLAISLVAGTLMGTLVNKIHADIEFHHKKPDPDVLQGKPASPLLMATKQIWIWTLPLLLLVALVLAFNIEPATLFQGADTMVLYGSSVLAVASMLVWALTKNEGNYQSIACEDCPPEPESATLKAIQDTHFITVWVVAAFITFELVSTLAGLDLAVWFNQYALWTPLIAALIGLIPGCGPQIVVTGLYLQGGLPFSALLANAISNDGDALFPAIALSPKAAFIATVYTLIPALVLGYGWYFIKLWT